MESRSKDSQEEADEVDERVPSKSAASHARKSSLCQSPKKTTKLNLNEKVLDDDSDAEDDSDDDDESDGNIDSDDEKVGQSKDVDSGSEQKQTVAKKGNSK